MAIESVSVWDLIKAGRFDDAIVCADEAYSANGSVFELRNRVFALLQLDRFGEAADQCRQVIQITGGEADSDYIFLGVALWAMGDQETAVGAWREGLDARFVDTAGGVEIPLLLYFSGVRSFSKKEILEARKMLRKIVGKKSNLNWPGPIAQLVLGNLSAEEVESHVDTIPILREKQLCQAEFFIGVNALENGDEVQFRGCMEKVCGFGSPCFSRHEYYLASSALR